MERDRQFLRRDRYGFAHLMTALTTIHRVTMHGSDEGGGRGPLATAIIGGGHITFCAGLVPVVYSLFVTWAKLPPAW